MFLAGERDQDINDGRRCERQIREKAGSNSAEKFPKGNVLSKQVRWIFVLSLNVRHFRLFSRLIKPILWSLCSWRI